MPRLRWILGVATILGIFSTWQASRLSALSGDKQPALWCLAVLNFAYWYIPALLAPLVLRLAERFRIRRAGRGTTLVVHISGVVLFATIVWIGLLAVRYTMLPADRWPPPQRLWTFAQRQFFTNLDWSLMTYAALAGLGLAAAFHHESRERAVRAAQLETRLVEARLQTLEAQLHPHFLFNTLNAISALVHRDPDSADRTISLLSDLLRLTLHRPGIQEVSVKEEVEFLEKYLQIERMRFQDRLTVRFSIDPDVLDAPVPRLILQPLVENAIRHGIAPRPEGGTLDIVARPHDGHLWLEVRDDGVGLSGRALDALEKGIGLSNTRSRLECLYGRNYRLEFSTGGRGLAVRIVLPMQVLQNPPRLSSDPSEAGQSQVA